MKVLLLDKPHNEIFNIPDQQLEAIKNTMYGDLTTPANRRPIMQLLLPELHKLWPDITPPPGNHFKYVCFLIATKFFSVKFFVINYQFSTFQLFYLYYSSRWYTSCRRRLSHHTRRSSRSSTHGRCANSRSGELITLSSPAIAALRSPSRSPKMAPLR